MGVELAEFQAAAVDSGLLSREDLQAVLGRWPAERPPPQAESLARELVRARKITRFQAAALLQGKGALLTYGNYVVLEKIGAGGMGVVYKARHKVMRRDVALKVISSAAMKMPSIAERFRREVEAAAKLSHPNIVAAYDADQSGGTLYLVMEHVAGTNLLQSVRERGPLSVSQATDCILQAARGLEHAHRQGVIHRDIKPANLLLDSGGCVKILDMGLARFDDVLSATGQRDGEIESLTRTGSIMGTVDFMSPEQALDTKHADQRSDIYSLGCTWYFLLTGRVMFPVETVMQKLLAHREQPAPDLAHADEPVPAELNDLFQRMVAKVPSLRPQSMAEIVRSLSDWQGRVSTSHPSSRLDHAAATAVRTGPNDAAEQFFESVMVATAENEKETAAASETFAGSRAAFDTRAEIAPETRAPTARRPTRLGWAVAAFLLLAWLGAGTWWARTGAPPDRTETNSGGVLPPIPPGPKPGPDPDPDPGPGPDPGPDPNPDPVPGPDPDPDPSPPLWTFPPGSHSLPGDPVDPAPSVPTQIVVGTAADEVPDLRAAFFRARPGDTILIRHRGPLEFSPIDLTGRTPLTIAGDRADGIDFWPILRQVADEEKPPVPGLFSGDKLDLTLRGIHLAVGGPNRPPVDAVFSLGEGRIKLENCSVTAGVSGTDKVPVGPSCPLVRATDPTGGIEVDLSQSFLRGSRLESCLDARRAAAVRVIADQVAWAGGVAPWVIAQDISGGFEINLNRCTLYNLSSFVDWQSPAVASGPAPLAKLTSVRSLFVGAYANEAPFLAWKSGDAQPNLPQSAEKGLVTFAGDENTIHRFTKLYVDPKRKERTDVIRLRSLWKTHDLNIREMDPQFRVWPVDALLEECTSRDFRPRFARSRSRSSEWPSGAHIGQLPPALARVIERPAETSDMAGRPRGEPRVLVVNQKTGPYKTLERAFEDARQSDDVIEITDDEVYMPRCNFSVAAQNRAVLHALAPHLVLRAADDRKPVIVLRDDVQDGPLPVFHSDGMRGRDDALFLLAAGGPSLQLDGLHFRVAIKNGTRHSILYAPVSFLRVTNCSAGDTSTAPGAQVGAYNPAKLFYHEGAFGWFENLLLHAAAPGDGTVRPSGATETSIRLNGPQSHYFRNCVFSGGGIGLKLIGLGSTRNLNIAHSTFFGRVAYLNDSGVSCIHCRDNLVICTGSPFLAESPIVPSDSRGSSGSGNALWFTSRMTPAERSSSANFLLPGPVLKAEPVFEGPASPKDPLRPYRLKPKQQGLPLATDGGPVGARTEYFPAMPTREFAQ